MTLAESCAKAYRAIFRIRGWVEFTLLYSELSTLVWEVVSEKRITDGDAIMQWFKDGSALKLWPKERKVMLIK